MTPRDKAMLALGAACLVVGTAAISAFGRVHVRFAYAYDGPPTEYAHTPAVKVVALHLREREGFHATGSAYGSLRERSYDLTLHNRSERVKRYQLVDELFDHRGKLVRRHIIGPVTAPPETEVTMEHHEFRLPAREKRYAHLWKYRLESLQE